MRNRIPLAAAAATAVLCAGAAAPTGEWSRTWERQGAPVTKRLALVLDVSGSMLGAPMEQAQRELLTIMSMFPDDGLVRVYVFCIGVKEFEPEKGWKKLPDGTLLERCAKWLSGWKGHGGTDLAAGVCAALANPEEDMTVLVVTDGEPDSPVNAHLSEIEKAQAKRKTPANVHVIAVADGLWPLPEHQKKFCLALASRNGGGLLVLERAGGADEEGPH